MTKTYYYAHTDPLFIANKILHPDKLLLQNNLLFSLLNINELLALLTMCGPKILNMCWTTTFGVLIYMSFLCQELNYLKTYPMFLYQQLGMNSMRA